MECTSASSFGFFLFSVYQLISLSFSLNSDGFSLLALKAAITTDPTGLLSFWSESDLTPCHWPGITCDHKYYRVTSISLPNRSFTGYIPSELGAIVSLQKLSLSYNNFSKPIPPHLFNANGLLSLDLSHNSLSGPIPYQITTLHSLVHLDLSYNSLSGSLPESLTNLTSLTGTLNLSFNQLSGEVPSSYGRLPVMVILDFRNNNLTGKIPQVGSLLNQGPTAFSGNPGLCGFPLQALCSEPEAQNPKAFSDPDNPKNPKPSSEFLEREKVKNGSVAVPLISGVSVVIGVVFVSVWAFHKKWKVDEGKVGKEKIEEEVSEEGQKGKFVVLDEGFGLELEDLLRASAYVVGKSRSGIVYKAVVGRRSGVAGTVVSVRRLSEGDATWRFKEFDSEVETIGRVQHPNIVRLRAYYYANDEKLLVTDFIGNGSLSTALHGGPANSLMQLSWAVRLRIAQVSARALAHIHECGPRKYVHGNIKSSKILVDDQMQPYISGFGLTRLVKTTNAGLRRENHLNNQIIINPKSSASSSSICYIAPEARVSGSKLTQKCDVYSFGIVLLEILTTRSPLVGVNNNGKSVESLVRKVFREERPLSEITDPALLQEIHAKEQEIVAAFHIALNCTEVDPEVRPGMKMVSDSLDRIKCQ